MKRGGKKGGENMAITEKIVKKSLMKQLELQQKNDEFYVDLVNDYMHYWKLTAELLYVFVLFVLTYGYMKVRYFKIYAPEV